MKTGEKDSEGEIGGCGRNNKSSAHFEDAKWDAESERTLEAAPEE